MKRYLAFPLLLLLAGISLLSCTKELEPPQAIVREQSLQNKKDLMAWYYGFYTYFRTLQYGNFSLLQDYQADMLNATKTNKKQYTHNWDEFNSSTQPVGTVYLSYYATIRNVNFFLDKVTSYSPERPSIADTVKIVRGAAHFFRAYCYHELALRWSRPYQLDELCVPWVGQLDLTDKPARAMQKEIFDNILADLGQAEKLLRAKVGRPNSTEVTVDVVRALKARVALTMGDWKMAKDACYDVANSAYSLMSSAVAIEKYWHEDRASNENLMLLPGNYPNELTQSMIALGERQSSKGNKLQPSWLPAQWVVDLYDDADWRKKVYFTNEELLDINDMLYPQKAWAINKFPGNPIFNHGSNLEYRHLPKPFRLPEIYLIWAEAAAMDGEPDVARDKLNTLRAARGIAAIEATVTGDDLLAEVRNERTRELAFEGYRLFDLRRWGLSCTRHNPQDEMFLNVSPREGYTELDRDNRDPKFVWPIPHHDIICNPSIRQNAGW